MRIIMIETSPVQKHFFTLVHALSPVPRASSCVTRYCGGKADLPITPPAILGLTISLRS